MKREHILLENAFIYDLPQNDPDMTGFSFDNVKGFWINNNGQACIQDATFSAPRTKKADIETGEDKKGE